MLKVWMTFLLANLSFFYGARSEVSWSRDASPASSAVDEVMRVCDGLMDNEQFKM